MKMQGFPRSIPEPADIIPAIGPHPRGDRETVAKGCRTRVIARRRCRHEEAERPSVFVRNRLKFRIQATFCAPQSGGPDPLF